MPEEEKTTVEETKTAEEEKTVEEKTDETKVKETLDAKEETKLGGGDGTKASVEPPTYEEVMNFIERHNLPKGLALGESMTIVMDMYHNGSKVETMRFIVFGMGQTTDADFNEDPTGWGSEFNRALFVGDVATGAVYGQYFGDDDSVKVVNTLSYWIDMTLNLDEDCITYFSLMAALCTIEKEASDDGGGGGGGRAQVQPTEKESMFTVSDVGCSMPLRDRQSFHLNMLLNISNK